MKKPVKSGYLKDGFMHISVEIDPDDFYEYKCILKEDGIKLGFAVGRLIRNELTKLRKVKNEK